MVLTRKEQFATTGSAEGDTFEIDSGGILQFSSNFSPDIYDAIVDAEGRGDFLLPSAAFAASTPSVPIKRVWIRAGTYVETANIDMSEGNTTLDGDGNVDIDLSDGYKVDIAATGAQINTGTISITSGEAGVVGVGTSFLTLGSDLLTTTTFIRINALWHRVLSVQDDTNLTLAKDYEGISVSGETFLAQEMVDGVTISGVNLIGAPAIALEFARVHQFSLDRIVISGSGETGGNDDWGWIVNDSGEGQVSKFIIKDGYRGGSNLIQTTSVRLSMCSFNNNTFDGFELNQSEDIVCNNCSFSQNGVRGIDVQNTFRSRFTNCIITDNDGLGIATAANSTNTVIDSCEISSNAGEGMSVDGYFVEVTSCIVNDNGTVGASIVGGNVTVSGGTFNNNGTDGLQVSGLGAQIVGTECSDNGSDGIALLSQGDTTAIIGGRYNGNSANGIDINADRTRIVGVECDGNTTNGILVNGAADRTTIQASVVLNNTSAQISGTGTNPNIGNNVIA